MTILKVLIAEDDQNIASLYRIALESRNHTVLVTYDGDECLEAYRDVLDRAVGASPNKGITKVNSDAITSPFDVVVLDYRMPMRDGLEVGKEILKLNPNQRVIFASAYVEDTLVESIKQLNQVVELMQKPFEPDVLVDTIEDKDVYTALEKLNLDIKQIKEINLTHWQTKELLEELRNILKGRTF